MNHKNRPLQTSIEKEDFMQLPQKEQNYLIYGGVTNNQARIIALENKTSGWFNQSKSIVGGAIGAVLFFALKFILGK